MFVLAFASLKGGVGKTTDAGMVALELARRYPGRVLAMDLDPNNNLTDFLLRKVEVEEIEARNIGHVLLSKLQLHQAVYQSCLDPGLAVVPAVPELAKVGRELSAKGPGILLKFPSSIQKLDYDWVIIDSPPALTLELQLAMYAADYVAVPVKANRWTLQAFGVVQGVVADVEEEIGHGPVLKSVPSICTEKQDSEIREILTDFPFANSLIPKNSAIETAVDAGIVLKVGSKAQVAIARFADEIEKWGADVNR